MRVTVPVVFMLLSGCASFGSGNYGGPAGPVLPDAVVVVRPPELYTRPEVDAINAEASCRSLARNMLEAQRCGIRR
jgi:hypothetical protein